MNPGGGAATWRSERVFVLAFALAGFAVAWLATGPRVLAVVNWDNGSFMVDLATQAKPWSSPVWNAHFAVRHVYLLGWYVLRPFGGTLADGFRLADAIAFAINAAVIASAASRLARDRVVAAFVTVAWMTAWVNLFLLLTLEDNILFLAPSAGVLWLCALRADRFGVRESAWAGVWAAFACLMSWQAILYLAPAFYCAAIAGPRARKLAERARTTGALFAAFVATLLVWCAVIAATSQLKLGALIVTMFSRPAGNFGVRSPLDVAGQLRALGVSAGYFITHTAYDPPPWPKQPAALAVAVWLLLVGVLAAATLWAWRLRRWTLHVLAATLVLFCAVTPLYRDVEYRYFIRYDFVPPVCALLAAAAWGELGERARRRGVRLAVIGALAAMTIAQTALAARWDHRRLAGYATLPSWIGTHPREAWYGREGQSWYGYFRGVRRAHPDACRYVLALDEISDGRWNLDILGALWSELPTHVAVFDPARGSVNGWRFKPNAVSLADARARKLDEACAYVSPDARRVLGAQ
ncbi:MAG TPA: hypothetical protein VFF06_18810 [Polyangia bacterium]|nr:hypothetical protein [Polyangia bacterium]